MQNPSPSAVTSLPVASSIWRGSRWDIQLALRITDVQETTAAAYSDHELAAWIQVQTKLLGLWGYHSRTGHAEQARLCNAPRKHRFPHTCCCLQVISLDVFASECTAPGLCQHGSPLFSLPGETALTTQRCCTAVCDMLTLSCTECLHQGPDQQPGSGCSVHWGRLVHETARPAFL